MEFEGQREALARIDWEEQAKKVMKEDMEMINRVARIKEVPLGTSMKEQNEMDLRRFALEIASRLPNEHVHANSVIWSAEQYIKFIKGEL